MCGRRRPSVGFFFALLLGLSMGLLSAPVFAGRAMNDTSMLDMPSFTVGTLASDESVVHLVFDFRKDKNGSGVNAIVGVPGGSYVFTRGDKRAGNYWTSVSITNGGSFGTGYSFNSDDNAAYINTSAGTNFAITDYLGSGYIVTRVAARAWCGQSANGTSKLRASLWSAGTSGALDLSLTDGRKVWDWRNFSSVSLYWPASSYGGTTMLNLSRPEGTGTIYIKILDIAVYVVPVRPSFLSLP